MTKSREFRRVLLRWLCAHSAATAWPVVVAATTIHVPVPQPTIQAGIDASSNGDTVAVANGTYTGAGNRNLRFAGRAIVLMSEHGASVCTIDAQNAARVFVFDAAETPSARVQGFTITHGLHATSGGGILIATSSPTFAACVITDNRTGNGAAGTLGIPGGNGGNGGGVHVTAGLPTFIDCVISSNHTGAGGNGFVSGAGPGGSAGGNGGAGAGLYVGTGSTVTLTRCIVTANVTGVGGTGGSSFICTPPLSCSSVGANGGNGGDGAGVFAAASVVAVNCLFRANETGAGGAAGFDNDPPSPNPGRGGNGGAWGGGVNAGVLRNSTVDGNLVAAAGSAGGIDATPSVSNSIVWNNSSTQISMGATVLFSDIAGGYAGAGNLNANPLFMNEANGDLHLTAGSPCIDAGSNNEVPAGVTTDLDGQQRIRDGNSDHVAVVDMGPYEFRNPTDVAAARGDCGALCVESPSADAVGMRYRIDSAAFVRLEVLDVAGRSIRVVETGARPAGRFTTLWDRRDARGIRTADGVYFAVLRANGERVVRKFVVVTR